MPGDSEDKFQAFLLPDISDANYEKIIKFSDDAPSWRTMSRGLNLEGMCKNKDCIAFKKKVWTILGYGTFHMSQVVCTCKCPECGNYTSGNKKIGVYKMELTGRGMKKIDSRPSTEAQTNAGDATDDEQNGDESEVEKVIEFKTITQNDEEGFLKFDGQNGKFVKWRFMTLEIKKLEEPQK